MTIVFLLIENYLNLQYVGMLEMVDMKENVEYIEECIIRQVSVI